MTTKVTTPVLLRSSRSYVLMVAVTLACTASLAEKPEWAGGDKGGKHEKNFQFDSNSQRIKQSSMGNRSENATVDTKHAGNVKVGGYFGNQQRVVVRNYYGEEYKAGRCPPGLAKKNNGCMPPGQARKWNVGRPLPRDVVYYSVPQSVVIQLGSPPAGQRYVRVGSDILLLAIGTGMVIDAIQNLGGL